jgi:hypothetical protein
VTEVSISKKSDCWSRNPEMLDEAVRLYKEEKKLSGTALAEHLSKKWGVEVTRSMLFGKLNRLGVLQESSRRRIKKKKPAKPAAPSAGDRRVRIKAAEPEEKPFSWNDDLDRFIMDQRNKRGASASQIGHYLMRAHGVRPSTGTIKARLNYLTERGYDVAEAISDSVTIKEENGGVPFTLHNFYTCHWPVSGEKENTFFCGKPLYHSAYCKEHSLRSCAVPPRNPKPLGG